MAPPPAAPEPAGIPAARSAPKLTLNVVHLISGPDKNTRQARTPAEARSRCQTWFVSKPPVARSDRSNIEEVQAWSRGRPTC